MLIRSLILGLIFLPLNAGASVMADGEHCVAYRADKTILFIKDQTVIGKNCEIAAQVLPEVGGLYHIEVNVPLRGFRSGDVDRDKDVMKMLKADERPELTFRTGSRNAEEWRALFTKSEFEIEGELLIGTKSFPLKLHSRYIEKPEGAEVQGVVHMKFTDFELTPPRVAAGFLVKAKPELDLHFQLQSQRVLGADSIRLMNKTNK